MRLYTRVGLVSDDAGGRTNLVPYVGESIGAGLVEEPLGRM